MKRRDEPVTKEADALLGAQIQAYARANWSGAADRKQAAEFAAHLDPKVRQRVDALGVDAENLVGVAPGEVLAKLQALERAAHLEDAGALQAATRQREHEEASFHSSTVLKANAKGMRNRAYHSTGRRTRG